VTGAGVANVEVRHDPMDHVVADPTSASAVHAVRGRVTGVLGAP
jgi:hypothetical protein